MRGTVSNIIKLSQDKTLSLQLVFPITLVVKHPLGPVALQGLQMRKRSEPLQKKISFRDSLDTDSYFCLPDRLSISRLD